MQVIIQLMNQQGQSPSISYDILFFVRIIFYVWVCAKLIQIILCRKRKLNIKERIERKYIFSHGEMIKAYSPEEVQVMQITLTNTLRNATQSLMPTRKRQEYQNGQINRKKVSFQTNLNLYYDPPVHDNENSLRWENIERKISEISAEKQQPLQQQIEPCPPNEDEEQMKENAEAAPLLLQTDQKTDLL